MNDITLHKNNFVRDVLFCHNNDLAVVIQNDNKEHFDDDFSETKSLQESDCYVDNLSANLYKNGKFEKTLFYFQNNNEYDGIYEDFEEKIYMKYKKMGVNGFIYYCICYDPKTNKKYKLNGNNLSLESFYHLFKNGEIMSASFYEKSCFLQFSFADRFGGMSDKMIKKENIRASYKGKTLNFETHFINTKIKMLKNENNFIVCSSFSSIYYIYNIAENILEKKIFDENLGFYGFYGNNNIFMYAFDDKYHYIKYFYNIYTKKYHKIYHQSFKKYKIKKNKVIYLHQEQTNTESLKRKPMRIRKKVFYILMCLKKMNVSQKMKIIKMIS